MSTASLRVFGQVSRLFENLSLHRNMATNTNTVKGKINFNSKHLKKGDPLPPYNGKLRVYNMRYCPFAQRTILALNAKNVDYEVININLIDKPEWLKSKSAFTKVPAIEIKENVTIYESLVTVEYLDEIYPQRPLLPKDPVMKAFDKIIIESIGPIFRISLKVVRGTEEVTKEAIEDYNNALDFIQEQLKNRGTKFLDGAEPGYADYMIWPWFERVLVLKDTASVLNIDPQRFKLLLEYLNNMEKDPVVSEYLIPKEVFLKFFEGYKQTPPNPNYELLTSDN